MPKIEIETCSMTPNFCALEAITKAMQQNYIRCKNGGKYQHETIINVISGRTLRVVETPADFEADSPCSCKYKVEIVRA